MANNFWCPNLPKGCHISFESPFSCGSNHIWHPSGKLGHQKLFDLENRPLFLVKFKLKLQDSHTCQKQKFVFYLICWSSLIDPIKWKINHTLHIPESFHVIDHFIQASKNISFWKICKISWSGYFKLPILGVCHIKSLVQYFLRGS